MRERIPCSLLTLRTIASFISSPCGDGYALYFPSSYTTCTFHLIPMRGRIRIVTTFVTRDDGFISSPCGDGYRLRARSQTNSRISSHPLAGTDTYSTQAPSEPFLVSSHPHAGTDTVGFFKVIGGSDQFHLIPMSGRINHFAITKKLWLNVSIRNFFSVTNLE